MKKYIALLIFIVLVLIAAQRYSQREGNAGERLYALHCANCHGKAGEGLRQLIPPLAGSDYLQRNAQQLACIIRHGLKGEIVVNGIAFQGEMPANTVIKDQELLQLIRFLHDQWLPSVPPPTYQQMEEKTKSCPQ